MDRKKLAETLSLVLQPQAVAVLLYALVSFTFSRGLRAVVFFVLSVLFVSVLPTVFVLFLAKRGRVSDPDLPRREERFFPYLGIVGMYGVLFVLLFLLSAPRELLAIALCYISVTFAGAVISLFWKISLHLAGIAGPVTALVLLIHPLFALLYGLLVPLGWARVFLRKHTVLQAISGSLMSFAITYGIIQWVAL
ncbi:MAG: hypothetical protein H5U36_03650 [Candidatus Caldatribacterium sp.]|nr:hypothetical protein [Candidatus Caldatribacterium sp.]